jgi:arsenate-mycothiol transferase
MAAGLMRDVAGDAVTVASAGTRPGAALDDLSVASLLEVSVDITDEHPKPVTDELIVDADLVVVLGAEARAQPADSTAVVTWNIDEPSERGIDGIEWMRLAPGSHRQRRGGPVAHEQCSDVPELCLTPGAC